MASGSGSGSGSRSRSDWGGYVEPRVVYGPHEDAFLFLGAQVGWSPARERRADSGGRCPLCGSGSGAEGAIRRGSDYVCAKCLRWGKDGIIPIPPGGPMLALAGPEMPPDERAALADAERATLAERALHPYRFDAQGRPHRA